MTLWLVPSDTAGRAARPAPFDGLGLRGNDSTPVDGRRRATIGPTALLGADGAGLDIALGVVLPWFLVLSASFSLGLMEAVVAEAIGHLDRHPPGAPRSDA